MGVFELIFRPFDHLTGSRLSLIIIAGKRLSPLYNPVFKDPVTFLKCAVKSDGAFTAVEGTLGVGLGERYTNSARPVIKGSIQGCATLFKPPQTSLFALKCRLSRGQLWL